MEDKTVKKFRNILAVSLSALMLIALCACSKDKGPDVTGKYICYEESYDNGAISISADRDRKSVV